MADPEHYVVLDGLSNNGKSDYTIQATGDIEMAKGKLGGVSVSRDSDASNVSGSSVSGTVWAQADGYRVYGGIKSIELSNPNHVQVHAGKIAGGESDSTSEGCQVTVRADQVEFVSGQGIGEGALDLTITHNIHGAQSVQEESKLETNSKDDLGTSIDNFDVPQGQSLSKQLTTAVKEREIGQDAFVGSADHGQSTADLTLQCGQPQEVTQTVPIGSDRGNQGKVKVHYTVGDLRG